MHILRFFSPIKPRNVKVISNSPVQLYEEKENAEVCVPMAMSLGSDSFPSSPSAAMALDFLRSQTAGRASLD